MTWVDGKGVVALIHHLNGCRPGRRQCACGALVKQGTDACAKCLSRSRWLRRKAWRVYGD